MLNMICTRDEATLFDYVYSEVVGVGSNCYSNEDASLFAEVINKIYINNQYPLVSYYRLEYYPFKLY